eukprot:1925396-Rhodomonas_salina.1
MSYLPDHPPHNAPFLGTELPPLSLLSPYHLLSPSCRNEFLSRPALFVTPPQLMSCKHGCDVSAPTSLQTSPALFDNTLPPIRWPSCQTTAGPLDQQMQVSLFMNTPNAQHEYNCMLLKNLQSNIARGETCATVQLAPPAQHVPAASFASFIAAPRCTISSPQNGHTAESASTGSSQQEVVALYPRKKREQGEGNGEALILDMKALSALFHLPLKEAATVLGICPTVGKCERVSPR